MMRALATACVLAPLVATPARAADWPDVPVPEGARGEVVSSHMVYNGLHMRASRFTAPMPLDQVKAFYRDQWGPAMADTPHRGKTLLGHATRDARHYITVELTGEGKNTTRAQIGVMALPKRAPSPNSLGAGFARMPGTIVAEDIVYLDTPARVRTLSMVNRYSPLQNSNFYQRSLLAQGYRGAPIGSTCTARSDSCSSRYSNGDKRITVSSSRTPAGTATIAVIE
jgi:hypothetical protein